MKDMITSSTESPRLRDTCLFLCAKKNGIASQQLRKKNGKNIFWLVYSPCTHALHPHTHPHAHTRTHIHTHTHAHTSTRTHRPDDSLATRIPCDDVGLFPPNGGTRDYIDAKASVDDLDDWFEYHTDFLPEELVLTLNSGLGGYVSQRRSIKMPLAAPKTNDECIDRLCDLLTTSCPETHLLLQRNIDRAVIGTHIRSFVCVRVCVHARVCASVYFAYYMHTHAGKSLAEIGSMEKYLVAALMVLRPTPNRGTI